MSDDELSQAMEKHAHWQAKERDSAEAILTTVLETKFQNRNTQTTLALVAGEAIGANEKLPWYEISQEKAEPILAQLQSQAAEAENAVAPRELNQPESSHHFQAAITDLIESGVLTSEFAAEIAKVLPVENLVGVVGNYARFDYRSDHFPTEESKRGKIEVGNQIIATYADKIRQTAEKVGVTITAEQSWELAQKRVLMHEYGHAALQTKKILTQQSVEAEGADNTFGAVTTRIDKEVNTAIMTEIAPAAELTEIFAAEPTEEYRGASQLQTVDERVASGFELMALFQGLQKVGLTSEQSQSFIQAIMAEESLKFKEKKMVIEFARAKGLAIEQLDQAMGDLFRTLRMDKNQLAELCRGGFGPQTLGYNFPLTPTEVAQFNRWEPKK